MPPKHTESVEELQAYFRYDAIPRAVSNIGDPDAVTYELRATPNHRIGER